jgi:predicted RNA-binding protein YlqC (UPF0109 family)
MKILISFVNTTHKSLYYQKFGLSQLALLDTNTFQIFFIKTNEIDDNGFSGLAKSNGYFYALSQSDVVTSLIKYSIRDLKIIKIVKSKKIVDPHSIMVDDNKLYVVSTGTNSIETFDTNLNYIKTHWKHPDVGAEKDEVHMNSIFKLNGDLVVSCFGKKNLDKWSSATNGYLMNTKNNNKVISGINHPHSAFEIGGNIYYCESSTGKIYENKKLLFKQDKSYVRGLSIVEDYLIVGVSGSRTNSKSTKVVLNPSETGKYISKTGIIIKNMRTYTIKYYDLSFIEKEIYDVLAIEEDDFNFDLGIIGMSVVKETSTLKENVFLSDLYTQKENSEENYKELDTKMNMIRNSIFFKPFNLLNKLENKMLKK